MAVTDVSIVQSNIDGSVDLLSIHSPLVFLANATFTGAAPDNLYVRIYDSTNALLGTFRGIPYKDVALNIRQFAFVADQILRQWLPLSEDFTQTAGTLVTISDLTKYFKIVFDTSETSVGTGYATMVADMDGFTVTYPYIMLCYFIVDGSYKHVQYLALSSADVTRDAFISKITTLFNSNYPGLLASGLVSIEADGATSYKLTNTTSPLTSSLLGSCDRTTPGKTVFTSYATPGISDEVEFEAVLSASQFGQSPANSDLFNNADQEYTAPVGKWGYAYFYDSVGTGTITAEVS